MAITAKIENGEKPQYVQQLSKVVPGNEWTEISGVVSVTGGSATIYIEGTFDFKLSHFFVFSIQMGQKKFCRNLKSEKKASKSTTTLLMGSHWPA